ncbi:SH3 domain-containing protein [Streptomyces sp. NPDC007991]|uniref:SH3 domain-containing protein n=1 Tax=Streptomyces sp. NPDC007991 TaxID=3364803 RepID=UPI0036E82835
MSLRSRLSIATAAGLLAAAAAVTPATAAAYDDLDPSGGDGGHHGRQDPSGGDGDEHGRHDERLFEGVVTASTLALRSAPNRGSQIIRFAHRGDIVEIFCKTGGETVQGNPLWYLLTDGTWAWGAARYIDNIGPAPRWC